MPEIIVPDDASDIFENDPVFQQVIRNFSCRYFSSAREALMASTTASDFGQRFIVNATMLNSFFGYASRHGYENINPSIGIREFVGLRIKAYIAKLIFANEGYFTVMAPSDKVLQAALDAISEPVIR